MATASSQRNDTSEAAIFSRLWDSIQSAELARQILKIGFSDADNTRMHELATKNQRGALSAAESEELDNYICVGDLVAILQSKARKYLKQPSTKIKHDG